MSYSEGGVGNLDIQDKVDNLNRVILNFEGGGKLKGLKHMIKVFVLALRSQFSQQLIHIALQKKLHPETFSEASLRGLSIQEQLIFQEWIKNHLDKKSF